MKNILVISFNCFEESSSNGRALGSLFKLIENEINISQIFIKQGKPDMMSGKYCFIDEYKLFKNFFSINRSASFFSVDLSSERKELADDNFAFKSIHKEIKKTPFKMMCRNIVWSLASLNTKSIIKWSKNIKPDYVVLQAGDLPFLYKLSIKIAKANHSSLVFYTSENYPFKKTNYVDLKKKSVIYPLLRKRLFSACKRLIKKADSSLFLTKSLMEEYRSYYSIPQQSYVVYPYSSLKPLPSKTRTSQLVLSYCGNLGLGRYETIIQIALIIKKKCPDSKILVCGGTNEFVKKELMKVKCINYLGQVPYKEVLNIYRDSDYLLHVESMNETIANDSKHAFSGKIADCISACRPIIFVGNGKMYESVFLRENEAALVYNSIKDFETDVDTGVLFNYSFNKEKQLNVAQKYFSEGAIREVVKKVFK